MGSFVSNLFTLLGVPAMGERLDSISLRSFLDVYPGPAFIIGTDGLSHTNPTLVYGNLALHSLVLGEGNTATLDDAAFFSAICDTSIFQRLYDATYPTTNTLNGSIGAWSIDLQPPWLTHESGPLRLEFTATPLLPLGDNSANRLFVYTALPARTSSALSPRGIDSAAQEHEPVPGRSSSRGSDRSVSRDSAVAMNTADLPSSLLYTFPWETTTLGPRSEWPESLKTMVRYIMATNIPTTIYWGWPDLVMIYNNAYAALAGSKHPSIYGQKASVAWGDQWDRANSIAELCKHGQSTWRTDDPLFFTSLTDFGNPREVYHTWHWTPIGQEDGSVGGILNSTYDTTRKVIAERRVQCVTDMISRLSEAKTHDEVLQVVLAVLSEHDIDFPFAALYLCSSSDTRARHYLKGDGSRRQKPLMVPIKLIKAKLNLAGVIGISDNHIAAPQSVEYVLNPATLRPHQNNSKSSPDSHERDSPDIVPTGESPSDPSTPSTDDKKLEDPHIESPWPFPALFSSGKTQIVSSLPDSVTEGLPKRSFGNVTNSAALLPIPIAYPGKNDGPVLPHAVLVLGLNTRLVYDESYAKWLESIAAAFTSRLIVVLQMETDAELARERARLDAAQSKFFMGVSHELRTPLTLVQAPLEQLAESQDLTPVVKSRVDLATRNVARLRRMVESVLDVSKLEAGDIKGHFRPVHLNEITESLTSLFRGVAETRGIELHLETQQQDYDAKPSTYLDIQLWEKMFCNLLTNAFKYTRAGKVTVLVSYDSTSAYLRVRDTGIGIPTAKQGEIFELFHRIHDLPVQGSGIGLAVAKDLVSLHGGKLSVSSRAESEYVDNTGSTFTIEIPLGCDHLAPERVDERTVSPSDLIFGQSKYWMELDTPTKVLETNEHNAISAPMFFKKSDIILVVDNDPDMRSFIGSIFAPHMTVFEARDGLEALEVAHSNNVNLILSDIGMPRINGPELLSRLRSEKKTMFVPVIFVTAALDNTEFFAGEADGIVDCVTKPFSIRDLLARSHLQLQIGKRRIKLENDFTERSSELQTLMNLSPVGIFRTDTLGRLTYTNPRWHQVTGYDATRDRDEWMNQIYSESQADAVQAWRGCLADGKSSSTRIQWVGGTWTQFDITPLLTPEGECLGALGTITDITNLHRLEETRVALAEEREQAAAARAHDAEVQRRAEVERRKAQELLIDVTSHELRQPVSAILQNADVVRANMKALKGILVGYSANDTPYIPTPQILAELDDDIQALNNIRQCGISQERIANDILSLSKIQLNALTILPVTFELKTEVQQILASFGAELASKSISLSIEFGASVNTPGFSTVFTDLGRLTQIITNLMSNAIRFTEMNARLSEIKVSLDVSSDPPIDESCLVPSVATQPGAEGDELQSVYIYMSFQDSGPGLLKEDLELLFHRFQEGSNDHHVFGGSGLDLFVCHHLCGLLDGRVEVSNSGNGATLRFFIRATKPPTPVQRISTSTVARGTLSSTPQAGPSRPASKRELRVLVTEDNKVNQTILMRQMKRAGFTAILASNGAQAVQIITENQASSSPFDVILMDLQMPVMDGFTATKEIRRLEEIGSLRRRNFIIAVTGNARAEQIQHARDSGVDDVMIKPYVLDQLIALMLAGPRAGSSV